MKRIHIILLGLILLTGLFFRTYMVVERYDFAHDQDLYSWIVKDVVVNHHFRLIGQLTSAPGIFIGPLFYYSLVPFFMLTNMDPIGALIPVTILGLFTILSYYLVLSKLFNKETGLIGAFLYAILITTVNGDRWSVPTVTTSIWAVWYFYAIIMISRKKYQVLPLLGLLVGLIWHVHIALIPTLIAIPVALIVAKKMPGLKQLGLFFLGLFIPSLPLLLFETRHHFGQSIALVQNFTTPHAGSRGLEKFVHVLSMVTQNTNALFFTPQSFAITQNILFVALILLIPFAIIRSKLISVKDLWPLYAWILGVILFFSATSSPISEYYFSNVNVILIAFVSLALSFLSKKNQLCKIVIALLLITVAVKNAEYMITVSYYHKGYLERKGLVEYIKQDAGKNRFPCFGISYITTPGENVGFRYFFWLAKLHLVHPTINVPVYNIVIPWELSKKEVTQKFGHIGLIPPTSIPSKDKIDKSCQTPDTNVTDSMFGYVE